MTTAHIHHAAQSAALKVQSIRNHLGDLESYLDDIEVNLDSINAGAENVASTYPLDLDAPAPPIEPPLQGWELAEIYRLIAPGQTYADPPEDWDFRLKLSMLRTKLREARGGTRAEAGDTIRDRDEEHGADRTDSRGSGGK